MQLRVSLAVLAVALVNVVFGLDWQSTPVNLAPGAGPAAQSPVAFPDQPPWPVEPIRPESADASAAANGAPASRAQATEDAAPPGCNVEACEAAYRSFRKADCTYQPNYGPRRQCRKR